MWLTYKKKIYIYRYIIGIGIYRYIGIRQCLVFTLHSYSYQKCLIGLRPRIGSFQGRKKCYNGAVGCLPTWPGWSPALGNYSPYQRGDLKCSPDNKSMYLNTGAKDNITLGLTIQSK